MTPIASASALIGTSTIATMKVLLVSFAFPPEPGGGAERSLRLAQYLPALGIETHVIAPESTRPSLSGDGLRVATQAWVHRTGILGPSRLHPSWSITAIPAAIRVVRKHRLDAVVTLAPPSSIHLVGAAVQRMTGAAWLAELPESPLTQGTGEAESAAVRAQATVDRAVARLVARHANAISCGSDATVAEARRLGPRGAVVAISGSDVEETADLLRSLR